MYITDELIYIQMPKTGCTQIAHLLDCIFDGKQVGKHNAASNSQIRSDKLFVSSIRNPWDWYLSLWTFGVQGRGGLMNRLTQKNYRYVLKKTLKKPIRNSPLLLHEMKKRVSLWQNVYDNSRNVKSFRKWLKRVHNPDNAPLLGEGYEKSAITEFCGFMSYRYLYLCCMDAENIYDQKSVTNFSDLLRFEEEACYIDSFIHQESLEEDLCKVVEKIKPLTKEEEDRIYRAKKINKSKRPLTISDYYDKASIDLVYRRERLLINKFNYEPPSPARS